MTLFSNQTFASGKKYDTQIHHKSLKNIILYRENRGECVM